MSGNETVMVMQRTSPNGTRRATWMGRAFVVVPAVLVRSQVLRNNLGASYLPADEFTDEWAEMWNGIPVLIGDHPRLRGENVSARDPALWEERMVGWIFNAHAERTGPETARLIGEVWLDETRADVVPGFRDVLDVVHAGRVVELSTGFRTRTEHGAGQFDGEEYEQIMHPAAPDHLVVSTEMTGACSVEDGCGLGANARHACGCGGACASQDAPPPRWLTEPRFAEPTSPWAAHAADGPDLVERARGDAGIAERRAEQALRTQIQVAKKKAKGAPVADRERWAQKVAALEKQLDDMLSARRVEKVERDFGQGASPFGRPTGA